MNGCRLGALCAIGMMVGGSTACTSLRVPDPNVVYIAFGDSATQGASAHDYPDTLVELLGVPARELVKESAGGETVADGVNRLRGLLDDGIYPNAEVLLFWQGGADLIDFIGEVDPFLFWSIHDADYPYDDELDTALDRIGDAIEDAVRLGKVRGLEVYVATYFPILSGFSTCEAAPLNILLPGQAERANGYVVRLNARIRQAASAAGAVLVDIAADAPDIAEDRGNYENCNHLSAEGNAMVAGVFRAALQQGGR